MSLRWSKEAKSNLKRKSINLELLHKKAMLRVAAQTKVQSPVRDGYFRGNWIGAYGSIDTTTFNETSRDAIGDVTIVIGGNSVLNFNIFYYTNSLPYAKKLADGHSAQASAGWIKAIARNFPRYVNEEMKRLPK